MATALKPLMHSVATALSGNRMKINYALTGFSVQAVSDFFARPPNGSDGWGGMESGARGRGNQPENITLRTGLVPEGSQADLFASPRSGLRVCLRG